VEQHVDAGVEHDVDPSAPGGLPNTGQVLGLGVGVDQLAGPAMVGVLDVAADSTGRQKAVDQGCAIEAVTALQVGGDRDRRTGSDAPDRREHRLGVAGVVIGQAERRGDGCARGPQGRGARRRDLACAGHVPHVDQHQRVAGTVQRPEVCGEWGKRIEVGCGGHAHTTPAAPRRHRRKVVGATDLATKPAGFDVEQLLVRHRDAIRVSAGGVGGAMQSGCRRRTGTPCRSGSSGARWW
jgi:hypothetical protein